MTSSVIVREKWANIFFLTEYGYAHIPLVNSFPKTNIFVLHMKYSNVSDIFEYSSKTKNHDQLVSQTRLRIIDTSLANETKNGSKSDSVFRQHAASIYGFVRQLVLFCFVCQKKIRLLLSKIGGWDSICWLFSQI